MQLYNVGAYNPSFSANKMPKIQAEYMNERMKNAETIDIFCHKSADEDAFNSQKVLYEYLENMGKKPRIITTDEPNNYGYDPKRYNILTVANVDKSMNKSDLAICLDFCEKERLNPNVADYLASYNVNNIIGFDHHNAHSLIVPDTLKISQQYKSVVDIPIQEPKNYYIDSSAKSCTSILYRFLSAINAPISKEQINSIYCGMLDDMNKSAFVKFFGKDKVSLLPKIEGEYNAKEVYDEVSSEILKSDKSDIVQHLNVIETLSSREQDFQKRLFDDVKIVGNGKFAYVEIPQDDSEWKILGEDNKRTSIILRDFRTRILSNAPDDSNISKNLHKKLDNIQAVGVFYSKSECGSYRVSLHSRNDYAKKYCDYIRDNLYPELVAGGHSNRCGGGINDANPDQCHTWVQYFVKASNLVK